MSQILTTDSLPRTTEIPASTGIANDSSAPVLLALVPQSAWQQALIRFTRQPLAVFGLCVVAALVVCALCADIIAPVPYDHIDLDATLQFPSTRHWFGTDAAGRDLLSRLLYGTRISLGVALTVQLFAFGIGIPLGAVAGLRGGVLDFIILRLIEVGTAFPSILFAIFLVAVMGGGIFSLILALSVTGWIEVCRLTRGQFLALRERDFVLAARSYGASDARIIFRHILPHALPSLLVMLAIGIPALIFAEAGLAFLGVGINDPLPSWGKLVNQGMDYMRLYWYLVLFPSVLIIVTMLSFTLIADGLRAALTPGESR